jgi:integrase/recombinase XerD
MNIPRYLDLFRKELELKRLSIHTIRNYESALRVFLEYYDSKYSEPKKIPIEIIKDYLRASCSVSKLKQNISALKLFYKFVIRQPLKFQYIEYPKKEHKRPILLSKSELTRLFSACTNLKHKTILATVYATGVRVSELLDIRLSDIDRENGVIHIMRGKGKKQRMVTMKPKLLAIIEKYREVYNPKEYLIENPNGGKYSKSSINSFIKKYIKLAGISNHVSIHQFRHLYATHSLEAGENLYNTQNALGHSSPKTVADFYYHLSPVIVANTYSPIEDIL